MAVMPTPAQNVLGYTVGAPVVPLAPITGYAVATTSNNVYGTTPTVVAFDFAESNTTTPGTAVNKFSKGARIEKLTGLFAASPAAMEIQLFASKDAGNTKRFIDSAERAAFTIVQTNKQTKVDFGFSPSDPLMLAPYEILYVGIGVSNTGFVARAVGAHYGL